MYLTPQRAKCRKCGFEKPHSPHDAWPAPQIGDFVACPKCWEDWLRQNIGEMETGYDFRHRHNNDKSKQEAGHDRSEIFALDL